MIRSQKWIQLSPGEYFSIGSSCLLVIEALASSVAGDFLLAIKERYEEKRYIINKNKQIPSKVSKSASYSIIAIRFLDVP